MLAMLGVILATAVLGVTAADTGVQHPYADPIPNSQTSHGCYSSSGSLKDPGGYPASAVSIGFCGVDTCVKKGYNVFAAKGTTCYCGNTYPPASARVDDKYCNYPCPAYGLEACGAIGDKPYFSVFNSGIKVDVASDKDTTSSSSSAAASSTSGGSSSSSSGGSSTSSAAASTSDASNESGGGANVGAIVGGSVAGIAALAGIIGVGMFYMRRQRNLAIEEEHRRNATISAFMGKPPGSSGGMSMTDARLDPVMANRRMSDGSIADNEDYSRKILRVTNA